MLPDTKVNLNSDFALSDNEDTAALVARLGLLGKAVEEEKLSLHEALESSACSYKKQICCMLTAGEISWNITIEPRSLWLQYQRMFQILRSFLLQKRLEVVPKNFM